MKNASELQTFPVSAGLLDPRHIQAIDPSSPVWVYLWLLNRVTRDEQRGEEFVGIVLNGRPTSIREIADELGIKERACRRHLARLVKGGYVLQKQSGVGTCTYTVTKSKRWAWKRQTRTDRKQPSKAPESQASLSFPIQDESGDSARQKVVSGSGEPPHQKVVSGSPSPHQILVRPDQKVVSAEGGTRARSHKPQKEAHTQGSESPALDEWVPKIAAEHPALAHLKGRPLSQVQEFSIAEAIIRDGPELVMAGTCNLRDAVSRWPREDQRFVPNPVRFYQQSEYLKDAAVWEGRSRKQPGPTGYVPLPSDYVPASVEARRELERRRAAVLQ